MSFLKLLKKVFLTNYRFKLGFYSFKIRKKPLIYQKKVSVSSCPELSKVALVVHAMH